MVNADNNDNLPEDKQTPSKGNDEHGATLAQIQEQLRSMNEALAATQQVIAAGSRKQEPVQDDNIYDPTVLRRTAQQDARQIVAEEQQKQLKLFSLGQTYPEIHSDAKVQQQVLQEQKMLPAHLRDTTEGYEMAVLRAVSKAGIVPKSHRKTVDDDVSFGNSGGARSAGSGRKKKVSEQTLQVAQMMGRDINDPEVLKRLEEAANRDTFTKYR